jgi:hypothetical protein
MTRIRLSLLPLLGLLLFPSPALEGQSLLSTQGLGFPVEPLDGRSMALGGVGLGLSGSSLLPTDPAAASRLLIPTVYVTLQPSWGEGSLEGEALTTRGTRFPLLGLAYPVRTWSGMVTLTFGSFMDQRWEIRQEKTIDLGGTDTPVTDRFTSDGGVSAVRLGWAQQLGEGLSVGVNVGSHTGSVRRTFARTFDSLSATGEVQPFRDGGKWRLTGLTASAGVNWTPTRLLHLAGSLTWSGNLDADPSDDTEGKEATFHLPVELRLGASSLLTPRLAVNIGVTRADWSDAGQGALDPEAVRETAWTMGGGLEWKGPTLGTRDIPLRIGYRRADLPFGFRGAAATETAFTGGLGLNLTQAEELVLAGLDLAVERGEREAGPLSETFWRGTLTVKVAGW